MIFIRRVFSKIYIVCGIIIALKSVHFLQNKHRLGGQAQTTFDFLDSQNYPVMSRIASYEIFLILQL